VRHSRGLARPSHERLKVGWLWLGPPPTGRADSFGTPSPDSIRGYFRLSLREGVRGLVGSREKCTAGNEQGAEEQGIQGGTREERPSVAKADGKFDGFMRRLKPPPPSVSSSVSRFSGACEARIHLLRAMYGLNRLWRKAFDEAIVSKSMPQGLNRLRKNTFIRDEDPKRVPQGLKPTLILQHLRHD
jgi:hypothetical protein